MQKLKVAIVIPTQTSLQSSLQNLLKVYEYLIEKYKIEVTIFTDSKNNFSYPKFKIEKIIGIDYKTPLEKVFLVLGLQRFYYTDLTEKLKGYDVIETSNPEFYWFAYQSYLAAKKYNSRLIYRTSQTVDGFYLFKLTKFIPISIARNAYDYAHKLFFTNPAAAERCIRLDLVNKNDKRITITGHATDTKTFKPLNTEKLDDKITLISVGGLYELKGHHLIIQALKILKGKNYRVDLLIVGDGYYKKNLTQLVNDLKLNENVKFLGSLNHEKLAKAYNNADIFVLANYQEITPAVNEALACGLPVVVMKCGGREFIIPSKKYGLVSRRMDVKDMAEKIEMLIKDRKKRENIAKKGRKRVLDNFSIEAVGEKFYKAFTS